MKTAKPTKDEEEEDDAEDKAIESKFKPKKKKAARLDLTGMSIAAIVASVNAKYGVNTLIKASDALGTKISFISTGCASLDIDLGGGFPENRIIEIRGPFSALKTTLSLCGAASFQKKYEDGLVIFVDVEKSMDVDYAISLGIDPVRMVIVNSDSGEQAVDLIHELLGVDRQVFMIVDSIAALVPTAEIEGSMDQQFMGLHPRLINRMMRIATARLKRSLYKSDAPKTTIIALNQLREKIGVMFGCNHADNLVNFVDGRSLPIRKVVEERIKGEVYSHRNGLVVKAEITDWHYNGSVSQKEDWMTVTCKAASSSTKNGVISFTVTPDHECLIYGADFYPCKELAVGDLLTSRRLTLASKEDRKIFRAILLGDATLTSKNVVLFRDSVDPDYACAKKELIYGNSNSTVLPWASEFHEKDYRNPFKVLPSIADCPAALAIWFMDDFHARYSESHCDASVTYSLKRFNSSREVMKLLLFLQTKFGDVTISSADGKVTFAFRKTAFDYLLDLIGPYVAKYMPRKLMHEFSPKELPFSRITKYREVPVPIVSIESGSAKKFKQRGKYDISIGGVRNYSVGNLDNGVIIHNSPETTPGGRGKDFFYSVMIRLSAPPGEKIQVKVVKNGVERKVLVGMSVHYSINKNKTGGSQFEEGQFKFYRRHFKHYTPNTMDNDAALLKLGLFHDVIKPSKQGLICPGGVVLSKKAAIAAKQLFGKPKLQRKILRAILVKAESDRSYEKQGASVIEVEDDE